MLTHADQSLKPMASAENVYSFTKLNFTDEMKLNVIAASSGGENKGMTGALQTFKNSSMVLTSWMKLVYLNIRQIKAIENACSDLKREIGEDLILQPGRELDL